MMAAVVSLVVILLGRLLFATGDYCVEFVGRQF